MQFSDVVTLCNGMVKALEERESVRNQLSDMTLLADNLNNDVQDLHNDLIVNSQQNYENQEITRSGNNCLVSRHPEDDQFLEDSSQVSSDGESIYFDALDYVHQEDSSTPEYG